MAGHIRTKTRIGTDEDDGAFIIGEAELKVPDGDKRLTVGEVAKLTGVQTTTLRYYDKIGLLCPARSGEGISNNRKLYDADDLERLQIILTLSEYGFGLEEIRCVLDDDEVDLYELISEKLIALKLQENRLRNMILFAQFVDLADSDLIEGLACGPSSIDALADIARQSPAYRDTLTRLMEMSDTQADQLLEALDPLIIDYALLDENDRFEGVEDAMERFFGWWSDAVVPVRNIGYLGFWAIFEDHSLVAEHIENVGSAGDAGFIEMSAFYVMMKHLMAEQRALIEEIARLSEEDVVLALEHARKLIERVACAMLGENANENYSPDELAEVALYVLVLMNNILINDHLCTYLELDEDSSPSDHAIEKVLRLIEVMVDDE